MKKYLLFIIIGIFIFSTNCFAGYWQKDNTGWWYELTQTESEKVVQKYKDRGAPLGYQKTDENHICTWIESEWWIISGSLFHFSNGYLDTNTTIDEIKIDSEGYALTVNNNRYSTNRSSGSSSSSGNGDKLATNIQYFSLDNLFPKVLNTFSPFGASKYDASGKTETLKIDGLNIITRTDCGGFAQAILGYYLLKNKILNSLDYEDIKLTSQTRPKYIKKINIGEIYQLKPYDILIKYSRHVIVITSINKSNGTVTFAHMTSKGFKKNCTLNATIGSGNTINFNGNLSSAFLNNEDSKNYEVWRLREDL